MIWLLTVLSAPVLVGMHWDELSEDVADRILSAEGLLLTAMAFPVLKFFHELGHAYATKIAGGEVHELGVMLLVFAPVPYVDASASIAFRSKWRRVLVGAAGMLTELFIAALAMFVWVMVEPGLVRSLCFQTVLIAGVSTVLFNINPLLRFDGYYILSDLHRDAQSGSAVDAPLVLAGRIDTCSACEDDPPRHRGAARDSGFWSTPRSPSSIAGSCCSASRSSWPPNISSLAR